MKLSEQYSHKINKLNELTYTPVPKTKTAVKKEEEKEEESIWAWMMPDMDWFDPIDYIKWAAILGLGGLQTRKLYHSIFGKKSGKLTRDGWLDRARAFRAMRKAGIPRHVSESAYRHMLNMVLQKDLHTMTDIVNKVTSGKMSADVGYNTAIARFTGLSAVQRTEILKDFKRLEAKLNTPIPSTKSVTNPYWTGTSTAASTQKTTSATNKPTGAELLARSRKNIK